MGFLVFALLTIVVDFAASQSLVLVGGNLNDGNEAIWGKVVELAGGRGVARIGVFTTASADPEDSAAYYIDIFVNIYGAANATYIPVTESSNNANDPSVAELTRQQTGFFFGGGDQSRVLKALRPRGRDTLVLTAVKDMFKAGATVGGTSAGAACLSDTVMITGGSSYDGLTYGAFSGGYKPLRPDELSYDEYGGLGFLAGWLPDTHFSERGREARLIRVLQDSRDRDIGTTRGFGLDEDMALLVLDLYTRPVGKVIGTRGGVFIADVTNTVVIPSETTNFEGVSVHYLTQDDTIDLTTGNITIASWKTNLKDNEYYNNAEVSNDILSSQRDRVWASAAAQFFNNKLDDVVTHYSYEKNPKFEITFDRVTGSGYGGIPPSNPEITVVSHQNLKVGIRENV
ncbi:cyanophycinase-like [Daphnia pulicaria]|uniref:cyanophycinase-like n=1 Tax=Daphnia pulicaria TaxID=35523 RepID=UPI001EEC3183|nr:cyanophycinase-like [Daphnia pulicaria]